MYDVARDKESGETGDFQSVAERQYLGIGKSEDAASLVAFLLSDASRFITGNSMVADGGKNYLIKMNADCPGHFGKEQSCIQ